MDFEFCQLIPWFGNLLGLGFLWMVSHQRRLKKMLHILAHRFAMANSRKKTSGRSCFWLRFTRDSVDATKIGFWVANQKSRGCFFSNTIDSIQTLIQRWKTFRTHHFKKCCRYGILLILWFLIKVGSCFKMIDQFRTYTWTFIQSSNLAINHSAVLNPIFRSSSIYSYDQGYVGFVVLNENYCQIGISRNDRWCFVSKWASWIGTIKKKKSSRLFETSLFTSQQWWKWPG